MLPESTLISFGNFIRLAQLLNVSPFSWDKNSHSLTEFKSGKSCWRLTIWKFGAVAQTLQTLYQVTNTINVFFFRDDVEPTEKIFDLLWFIIFFSNSILQYFIYREREGIRSCINRIFAFRHFPGFFPQRKTLLLIITEMMLKTSLFSIIFGNCAITFLFLHNPEKSRFCYSAIPFEGKRYFLWLFFLFEWYTVVYSWCFWMFNVIVLLLYITLTHSQFQRFNLATKLLTNGELPAVVTRARKKRIAILFPQIQVQVESSTNLMDSSRTWSLMKCYNSFLVLSKIFNSIFSSHVIAGLVTSVIIYQVLCTYLVVRFHAVIPSFITVVFAYWSCFHTTFELYILLKMGQVNTSSQALIRCWKTMSQNPLEKLTVKSFAPCEFKLWGVRIRKKSPLVFVVHGCKAVKHLLLIS